MGVALHTPPSPGSAPERNRFVRGTVTWWHSRAGRSLLFEITLFVVGFLIYKQVRYLSRDQVSAAFDNAHRLIDVERALGIFNEVSLQEALLPATWLIGLLNRYYIVMHFVGTTLAMVWLYIFHPERYRLIRRVLFVVSGLALIIHVGMPLAPPRMITEFGFVDTLAQYGPSLYENDAVESYANEFAAMPSLHFGYAMLVAIGIVGASRSRWRWLVVAHPLITLWAIVITANHFWLDAVIAAALTLGTLAVFRSRRSADDDADRDPDDEIVATSTHAP